MAIIVVVFIILAVFAFMTGARAKLLAQQARSAGKAVNIYASKMSNGLCISSSINTCVFIFIVEYNSTHARVVDSTTLKPSQQYCFNTQQNIAVVAGSGALFTIDQSVVEL
ncbi:MAG: hypothetical protein QXL22_05415 [Candidatus Nezhaarchaeales archaeon]